MSILYRPQRGSLAEAMEEIKEFSSVKEMLEYIVEEHEKAFDIFDIYTSYYGYDERIEWDTYIITVGRYYTENYLEKYHHPQAIGFCAFAQGPEMIVEQQKAELTEENERLMRENGALRANNEGVDAVIDFGAKCSEKTDQEIAKIKAGIFEDIECEAQIAFINGDEENAMLVIGYDDYDAIKKKMGVNQDE